MDIQPSGSCTAQSRRREIASDIVKLLAAGLSQDGLEEALQREADAQASCYAAPDIKLGVAASMARTPPVFPSFPSSEHR